MSTRTVCFGSYCFAFPGKDEDVTQYTRDDIVITAGTIVFVAAAAIGLFLFGYHYGSSFPDAWDSPVVQLSYFLSH